METNTIGIIISILSLIVASLTLWSQRETQKNTAPTIDMRIQKLLWLNLIKQFYYKIQYLHMLKIMLKKSQFKKKPEDSFIQSLSIAPENYIHEELFYKKKYAEYYGNVYWIKKHIIDYNLYVSSVANHLDQKNIKTENIDRMLSLIDALCSSLLKYYQKIFEVDKKEDMSTMLDIELFNKQREEIEECKVGHDVSLKDEMAYTRKEDAFINFFKDLDGFANKYYSIINDYMGFYINRKKGRIVLVDK